MSTQRHRISARKNVAAPNSDPSAENNDPDYDTESGSEQDQQEAAPEVQFDRAQEAMQLQMSLKILESMQGDCSADELAGKMKLLRAAMPSNKVRAAGSPFPACASSRSDACVSRLLLLDHGSEGSVRQDEGRDR